MTPCRIGRHQRWGPAAFGRLAVGVWSYHLGLAPGLAQQQPPPAAGLYPWGDCRPSGFGPLVRLCVLGFWFFWRRGAGAGLGGYHGGSHGRAAAIEAWHPVGHGTTFTVRAPNRGRGLATAA